MAIKIVNMAIMPYSSGDNIRAKTRLTRKEIPELDMLSIKLHPTPFAVLFFSVVSDKIFLSFVHHFIILLILSARNRVHPLSNIQIPFLKPNGENFSPKK